MMMKLLPLPTIGRGGRGRQRSSSEAPEPASFYHCLLPAQSKAVPTACCEVLLIGVQWRRFWEASRRCQEDVTLTCKVAPTYPYFFAICSLTYTDSPREAVTANFALMLTDIKEFNKEAVEIVQRRLTMGTNSVISKVQPNKSVLTLPYKRWSFIARHGLTYYMYTYVS
jgi:hypothetical protein